MKKYYSQTAIKFQVMLITNDNLDHDVNKYSTLITKNGSLVDTAREFT